MKKYLLYFLLIFATLTPSYAIYRVSRVPQEAYEQAAAPFSAIFQVHIKTAQGTSFGSASYVRDPKTGRTFILTAAHVLENAIESRLQTPYGSIKLRHVSFFKDYLMRTYADKRYAASFANAVYGKRLYGGRIDDNPFIEEAIHAYGGDLAVAFLEIPHVLPVQPLELADDFDPTQKIPLRAVGFGESGVGRQVGHWTGTICGSGRKHAFTPKLETGIVLSIRDLETNERLEHRSWMSFFRDDATLELPGQVGYGDSGGPVLALQNGKWQIVGVITSTLPAVRTPFFLHNETAWQFFVRRTGELFSPKSSLSYVFGQQANTFGSESFFAGATSVLVKDWLKEVLEKKYS